MKEVIIFKCDYCEKKYASKYKMKDHEKKCFANEKNKTCGSCNHAHYKKCDIGIKKDSDLPKYHCEHYEITEW